MNRGTNFNILSIKKLYAEFERLQTIMQELKKENYNLKMQLKDSEGLMEKVTVILFRNLSSVPKLTG